MKDDKVSNSPKVQDSETRPSISLDAKFYITNINIEFTPDNSDHFNPTVMNVDVFSSERGHGEALIFKKTSPREWRYNGTIALTNEVTLIARWDETENFGIVHLVKTELKKWKENAGLHDKIVQEFVTETEGPLARLVFELAIIPPEESMAQQGDGDLSHYETLVEDLSDNTPQEPHLLNTIGRILLARFRSARNIGDINNSVLAHDLAIQLLPVDDAEFMDFLHDSGVAVLERYNVTGNLTDINQAVSRFEVVVEGTFDGHESKPGWLNNLGIVLMMRFQHAGDLTDIYKAISSQQKAVYLTPEDDAGMPNLLNSLGASFSRCFEHSGDLTDITEAISSLQKAVHLTPAGHAGMPARLNNLGNAFTKRFESTGDLTDISEAIFSLQKAAHLTPNGDADMSNLLNSLGIAFARRLERTGDPTDLSEAISFFHKAVHLTLDGHAEMPARLNNLGNLLSTRFGRTGDLTDVSEAISSQQKAAHLTPEGHASMPTLLSNLGTSFSDRFKHTGDLTDISEAVFSLQKAVHLTPESHANMPALLNNLGIFLSQRFGLTEDLTDISEAIFFLKKAIHLIPEGHAKIPSLLNNLGTSLWKRFERTGDLTDISEAISSLQKAVHLIPEGHTDIPAWLNNLGNSLTKRFQHTGNLTDISAAISSQQKAVYLTADGHADMPSLLDSLGNSFLQRFKFTEDFADISEAIFFQKKAVHLTPEGHTDISNFLNHLASSFVARFERAGDPADINKAISNYRLSATYFSGPPSIRLYGAKQWAHWAQISDPSELLDAYRTIIHLISLFAGLEQTIQERYANLINISELSAFAAAAAFRFGEHDLALEWLEQGRCLVWSQLNNLRTPLDDLRICNPALADDILRVSRALENAGSRAEPAAFTFETSMMKRISAQDEATAHIKLAREWDQLLTKVRAIPHFENFLKPASCSTILKHIPDSGPVVVINIHKDRSDALALVSGIEEPLHISLHEFSYEKADNLRNHLKNHLLESGVRMRGSERDTRGMRYKTSSSGVIKDVLCQLWTCVVKPILDGLGYSESPSNISRIWWCVTGPLAFLPIHAAGIYASTKSSPEISSTLSDFAVSSYTPTVRALVERVQSPRGITKKKMGLFMISQPATPMLPPLPGTTKEVQAIKQLLINHKFRHLCLERDAATVNPVITNMGAYSCVHFACHAAQNTDEPLQSGFYLHDGRLELLSIIKEQLVGVDLAFLSACQTSTGDEKLSEEAVHLAAGMLAAGYRGVVATMWSIQDFYGAKIAEDFYKNLITHGADDKKSSEELSSDGAAFALHYATQHIRKTLGDSESSLLTWVPYVHFGL